MTEWLTSGTEDDVRPRMFAARAAGEPIALATISAADLGPRPVGAQMVITEDAMWGFLSGGCIEADVALHARRTLADGEPRRLVYGRGSPFIDMRLPCGGRLEILVERVLPDDPALARLQALTEVREPTLWQSDGRRRICDPERQPSAFEGAVVRTVHDPRQRLVVIGEDPFALAMAALGTRIGWETILLTPFGPESEPPHGVICDRRPLGRAFEALRPDRWTAIAVASHDLDLDREALVAALRSEASYVGVLGSRRRLPDRIAGLRAAGLADKDIDRLKAPIGLPIRARSPWEVAVAVVGEIIALRDEPVHRLAPAAQPAAYAATDG